MFHNFGKVFAFSFHNQAGNKGYRLLTGVLGLILLAAPIVVMLLIAFFSTGGKEEEKAIEACGAKSIRIVSEYGTKPGDPSILNTLPEENYTSITYSVSSDLDTAMKEAASDEAGMVLRFYPEDEYVRADLLIPEGSSVQKQEAANYFDLISNYQGVYNMLISGVSQSTLAELMPGNVYETYTEAGYQKGITIDEDVSGRDVLIRDQVKSVLQMVIPYLTIMLFYFMILTYGNSIALSLVMEKESKLMDTMLVSVHPEALVFGKLLAAILAGLIQLFVWLAALIAGLGIGVKLTESLFPDYVSSLGVFLKYIGDLGIFQPVNILLGILFMCFGFVMYASIAAVVGAMCANREEVASQSMIYVLPLVASFMLLMMGGGLSAGGAPAWMKFVPFTAALYMPGEMALGTSGLLVSVISLALLVALTLVVVILAGKTYKMMSLYKGNKPNLMKVLKDLGKK